MGSINEVAQTNGGQPEPTQSDRDISEHKQWESEFPYHWDADELVSRRDLLQFAVYASGTLFLGTAFLAVLRHLVHGPKSSVQQIASMGDVAQGEAMYFHYPGPEDQAVLLHLDDGGFVAYSQTCTHLSCSVFYEKDKNRLFCPCHEGVFDPRTGVPIAGPPVRPLPRVKLTSSGDTLYAIGMEP